MNVSRYLTLTNAVMVISVVALIGWGISVYQWRTYSECQAQVTNTVIDVLQIRSVSGDREQEAEHRADLAFREAMESVLAQPPVPEAKLRTSLAQLQRALDDQEQKREEAEQVRAAHPIPELPAESC